MRRKLTILGMAVTAMLAFAAMSAAAAQAANWEVCQNVGAGNGTHNNAQCTEEGGTKEYKEVLVPEGEANAYTVESYLQAGNTIKLEGPVTITCSTLETQEGKIWNEPAPTQGKDSAILHFSKCTASGGCTVTEPISTEVVHTHLFTKEEGGKKYAYDVFQPQSGKPFVKITLSNCLIAGTYSVEGETCGKPVNPLGVQAVEQQQEFSKAIQEQCVKDKAISKGLNLGFLGSAWMNGSVETKLTGTNAGKDWGAI